MTDERPQKEPRARRRNKMVTLSAGVVLTVAAVLLALWAARPDASAQTGCPPGLTSFTPGMPARASDVNCNFATLEGRLATLEGRLATVESSVMFFTTTECPAGYTPFVSAQGRYLVGAPPSGDVGVTVGQALANLENRPVGRHTHGIDDPGHYHSPAVRDIPYGGGILGNGDHAFSGGGDASFGSSGSAFRTADAMTGITVETAGAVDGTLAPYVQLQVCIKTLAIR